MSQPAPVERQSMESLAAQVADDFVESNNWQDLQDPGASRSGSNNYLQNAATAEAALTAAIERRFKASGASGPSYGTIVASGGIT